MISITSVDYNNYNSNDNILNTKQFIEQFVFL